jgi:hypothetical protein
VVDPTEEAFRALAGSSPWRWSTLHFTRRGEGSPVEAWVRRPGWMRVRVDGHDELIADEPGSSTATAWAVSTGGPAPDDEAPPALESVFRPDDPMYQDYTWVAMLDPFELSHHTRIANLAEGSRGGRDVWRARVWAEDGYEPRCGCCPLLWSEISERDEASNGGPTWREGHPEVVYADGFDVALDVQTGVLVELRPRGGDRPDDTIDVDIHAVDASIS